MRTADIAEGEDAVAAVRAIAGAWVNAVGFISEVALSVPRDDGEESIELPGRVALLSLQGPPAGPLMATISRMTDAGPAILGGRLTRARSLGVSLLVQEVQEVQEATDASAPATPAGLDAAGGAAVEPDDEEEEDDEALELPQYNDQVLHPKFGLCDVMVVKGERMKIRDVNGPKRVREIHLGVVKVLQPRLKEGKKIFPLSRRG